MRARVQRPGEHGIVLVAVLWGVALLSLIAMTMAATVRTGDRLSENLVQRAAASAIADGGVSRAILALLDPVVGRRWRIDGVPIAFEFAGRSLSIRIEDEQGKIDLNAADDRLLVALLQSAGLSYDAAGALVDKIADWRTPGELHRLNGATAADYRARGYPYGPKGAPFDSVDELRNVMDMTPELFARIAPALTVYSGSPTVNPATAPREVLLALGGHDVDPARVDAMLAARRSGDSAAGSAVSADAGVQLATADLTGRSFSIRVTLKDVPGVQRVAVVKFTGDPRKPYWVQAWN